MSEPFTTVTCPECLTGQEIQPATPTRCISCGAEIDTVPGKYMTVIPRHAVSQEATTKAHPPSRTGGAA